MRIALLQVKSVAGDIAGNAKRILAAVEEAARQHAELCATPAMALCGAMPQALMRDADFLRECEEESAKLAKKTRPYMPLLLGMPVYKENGRKSGAGHDFLQERVAVNGISLLEAGDVLPFWEAEKYPHFAVYQLGKRCLAVSANLDALNSTELFALFKKHLPAGMRANGVLNMAALPFVVHSDAEWEERVQIFAEECATPVASVNVCGGQGEYVYAGASFFAGSDGEIRARAPHFKDSVLTLDIFARNEGSLAPAKEEIDEEKLLWQALVLATRDFVQASGFSDVVLGLSGGVDSALVSALAAEALGKEHVLGVLMPSPYTSQESIDDAYALAEKLGIATENIAIAPLMDAYNAVLTPVFERMKTGETASHSATDTCFENIQARVRANVLMAISNSTGRMVLATGNKSENFVGYSTLYGDMAGSLEPLADVSKTQVYALCRWLNSQNGGEIIPQNIIDKAPTAELRPNQKDSDSLPEYDVMDAVMDACAHGIAGQNELLPFADDNAEDVARVKKLWFTAEFKRRQAAPTVKVSEQCFSTDWQLPLGVKPSNAE